MTKKDIKNEIDKLLNYNSAGQILQLNDDSLERAYEAYIWALCKRAVEGAGGKVELVGINSKGLPKTIVLRGAPGHMASINQNFCYFDCCLREKRFEIHLDVQYEGISGVLHEVDISIYDHDSAEKVRKEFKQPKASKMIVAIECKFYSSKPTNLALGRQFVGLVSDFSSMKMNAFVANKARDNLNQFLASKGNIEPFTALEPGDSKMEERFVRYLEQTLWKWTW